MKKLAHALMATHILCSPVVNYAQGHAKSGKNKAQVCTACHGQEGISSMPEWPNLAGQNEAYFIKQIKEMQKGALRNAPTMSTIIATLTEQDIEDLAAYYAKMPTASGTTDSKYSTRGEQLYRGGDFSKHITACIACHGPKGTGNAQAGFPALSGQHAAYTLVQLHAFKDKKRTNDLNHIMQDICARMSDDDMDAVAHYIQGLY